MSKKTFLLKQLINLPKSAKNPCLLLGWEKSIFAYNPIAKYQGDSIEEFREFAKTNQKCQLIGYFSYDLSYKLHKVKQTAKDDLNLPKIYFLAFDRWEEFIIPSNDKETSPKHSQKNQQSEFKSNISKSDYHEAYNKIKSYIQEGDIYQINLSHRLEALSDTPARELFNKVASANPVDFLAYIEADGFEILSASPERFIRTKGEHIETCPIKGTRPRGENKKEDEELKKELIESKKEAAELNMITDLLRNDIGKVSKPGTVKVEGHRLIQKCPTVWHTYSRITAELDLKPLDALISMLPGGSITGCPKKRAIEIIDELEPTTRGIYTGVIGHIEPNQNLDFSIAIRTIVKKKKKLYLQVGGGIVLDSEEKDEYQETLDKAKSFMKILEQ